MRPDSSTEAAVTAAFNSILTSYEKRDRQALQRALVPDPDLVCFGTGADEKRVGLQETMSQFDRDWSQADSATMKLGWRSVSARGDVAWVSADGNAVFKVAGQEMAMPVRATVVFERRDGRWLIAHMHMSTPAMAQKEGESWTEQNAQTN